jgi:hypothetical protein
VRVSLKQTDHSVGFRQSAALRAGRQQRLKAAPEVIRDVGLLWVKEPLHLQAVHEGHQRTGRASAVDVAPQVTVSRGPFQGLAHHLQDGSLALADVAVDRMASHDAFGGRDHVQPHELPGARNGRQGRQAADEVEAVRNRLAELPADDVVAPGEDGPQQMLLAREVVQQPGLAQARPPRDVTQRAPVEAGRGEHGQGRVEDLRPTAPGAVVLAPWATACHALSLR